MEFAGWVLWLAPARGKHQRRLLSLVKVHFGYTKGDSITSKDIKPQRETDIEERTSHRPTHLFNFGADDIITRDGTAQRESHN